MIRLLPVLLLAFVTAPAGAAERTYTVASFDRLRVTGPFRVVLTIGPSPAATAEGDPRATDGIEIGVQGTTLVVRAGVNGWADQPMPRGGGVPIIRLSTPMLRGASMIGGADLTITGPIRAQRVDLSLSGGGSLSADGVDADQFAATIVGSGSMTIKGRAARARLATNGPAQMQAGALVADDLAVRTDGNGEMVAQARYTAAIVTAGVGSVTVYGTPACTISPKADGPVRCGAPMPPAMPAR